MAKNRWASADSWPPQHARPKTFYLHSNGHANSLYGDGSLSLEGRTAASLDTFIYDPMNPVPAVGGGLCCLGGAASQAAMISAASKRVQTCLSMTRRGSPNH